MLDLLKIMIDNILAWLGILIMVAMAVSYFWPEGDNEKEAE